MSITILGISAYYDDSPAALLVEEKITAAVQEEGFTRKSLSFTPQGFRSFIAAVPMWLKDKLFLKKALALIFSPLAFDGLSLWIDESFAQESYRSRSGSARAL